MCGCLFFFKQKTAYEMRISDWSSDVCSSDLPATFRLLHQDDADHHGRDHGLNDEQEGEKTGHRNFPKAWMARRGPWLEAHIETKPPRFKPRVRGRRPRSFSSPPRKRGPLEGWPPLRCPHPFRSWSAQGRPFRASPQPCPALDVRREFSREKT